MPLGTLSTLLASEFSAILVVGVDEAASCALPSSVTWDWVKRGEGEGEGVMGIAHSSSLTGLMEMLPGISSTYERHGLITQDVCICTFPHSSSNLAIVPSSPLTTCHLDGSTGARNAGRLVRTSQWQAVLGETSECNHE